MFSIYKKIGWFFKQEKKRYIAYFIVSIILSYIQTLPPKLLGEALDEIAQGLMNTKMLWTTVGLMSLIAVLIFLGFNIRQRLSMYGNFKLQYQLRNRLMTYWSKMDAHYYADHDTGDLMAVATTDVNQICLASSRILNQLVTSVFMMGFVLYQMVTTVDLKLTLITIIPLPLVIVVVFFMSRTVRRLFVAARDAFGQFNTTTLESVAGVQVVRAFVQEQNDIQKLKNAALKAKETELKAMRIDAAFGPLFRCVFSVALILAISCGVFMVYNQQITAGELVTFNIYLGMLRGPIWSAGTVLNALQRSNAAYDRFERFTNVELTLEHGDDLKPLDSVQDIHFENYSFTYPHSEFESLHHINLDIHKGQTVGIVGKTGSGKSTLILQLLRYYKKGEGVFEVNGQSVEQLNYEDLRHTIGYVPQEHILFSKTVRQNIELGYIGDVEEAKLMEAIRLADFEKDLKYLRDGLETLCGEDGTMLSGGQKQRLSIARAFLADPEILILDDSLSAVDGNTEANIIASLKKTRQNKTTLIVAHRLSALSHADVILVMENGTIVDRGTHEELLAHGGWYKEQFEHQILNGGEA